MTGGGHKPGSGLTGVLALCALLSACGSDSHPTLTLSPKPPPVRKAVRPHDEIDDMVAAVSSNRAASPVQLRYDLSDRPEVGQTVTLNVALVPLAPTERLSVHFQGGEDLAIVEGADAPPVERAGEGTPIRHTVRFLAKRDGLFTLDALVSAASAGQVVERTFSIPVIAGKGLPALPRSEATATAATTPRKTR